MDHGLERNYLDAYTVTMAPNGADVSWGEIAWEDWEDSHLRGHDAGHRHGKARGG